MAEQLRLLVIEDVPEVATHLRTLLNTQHQIRMLDVIESSSLGVAAVTQLKPDVVVLDSLLQGNPDGEQLARTIREREPGIGIVMLTVPDNEIQPNPTAGIDAVMVMPFTGFDLTTTVRRVHQTRTAEAARAGSLTVSLFSPKGGVGRTTMAYNLAVALASDQRVCLVDGTIQFGDLRGLLRVPPVAPSILNLPTDRITRTDLDEVTWRDPSGIDILLAPPRIELAEMVTVSDIEKALGILRQAYEFVIIDTRSGLQDDVLAFLDASDVVLLLVTSDYVALRSLSMAIETFQSIGYGPSKLVTVLNRASDGANLSKAKVEEALARKIDFEVASDYRVVGAANNEGIPFVTATPAAEVSRDVRAMADMLRARLRTPLAASARA